MSLSCPVCNHPARAGAKFCSVCGASFAAATPGRLAIGQVLNRRYKLVRPLSKGGMGAIYLVEDGSVFGKQRVLKEMLDYVDPADYPDPAAYQKAVQHAHQRFEEEARTLASLKHRGIPEIIDYFSEAGRNYIVMEYIEGANLEQKLTRSDDQGRTVPGQPYSAEEVIRYGIQVCKVLEYLAGLPKPVVHQDIKPANLIVDRSGEVWLVDFGTAKARLAVQPGGKVGLQKSSVYGTVGYAPPEQYQGLSEPRSDVYALAATLYHLATDDDPRRHPFSFPRLPALPQGLWAALDAALQQDVARRPTAAQLRSQLEALLAPTNTAEPIHLRSGDVARNIAELAQACDRHWEDGKFHLYRGDFQERLRKWGRTDLEAKAAAIRQQHANQDLGLDAFIRLLDPAYPPPRVQVTPPVQDLGRVPWGEQRTVQIEVRNAGKGCLQGRASAQAPWLAVTPTDFVVHDRQFLKVTADTARMTPRDGQVQAGRILLDAGPGGQAVAEIRVTVPEPRVAVSPAALDLGAAYQGGIRTAQLTVSNQGSSPCEVTVVGSAAWIKAAPDRFRCEPGQSLAVTVAADTSHMRLGTHRTTLAVRSTAGGWQDETGVQVALELPWLRTFVHRYRAALAVLAVVILLLAAWDGMQLQKQLTYNRGQTLLAAGRWEEARAVFVQLGNYRDASWYVLETYYQAGQAYLAGQRWEEAAAAFVQAGSHRDAPTQVLETYYQAGQAYQAAQRWEEAAAAFAQAGNHRDAPTQVLETYYQAGQAYQAAQRWEEAAAAFAQAGSYRDAPAQILETHYRAGLAYRDKQQWQEAAIAFARAGDYRDARSLLQDVYARAGPIVSSTDGMQQILVPAGEFLMGSADSDADADSDEKPQHRVYLDTFWIDRTEVTKEQYQKCVTAGKCRAPSCSGTGQGDHPVVCVSWQDAANYCAWAGQRLPTEAEWEKAARGTDGRKYPWGDQAPNCTLANHFGCINSTNVVGSYPSGASPFGVLDIAGNVWEWVADWYDDQYYVRAPARNPMGPASGQNRVLRGGSWNDDQGRVRAAFRVGSSPDLRSGNIGFRCAYSP